MRPDTEWCRDERCTVEALHPAHLVVKGPGRPPRGMERTPPERRAHAKAHFDKLRKKFGNQKLDSTCSVCRGKGWVRNWTRGCPACFGHGRLTVAMQQVWEKHCERVA